MKRVARLVIPALIFAALGFVGVLALSLIAPMLFGFQSLTMLTGSMGPAIPVGSVIIDETIKPLDARPGDVLTFADPDYPDRLLTHRLRSVKAENNLAYMVTRGDANDADERWSVPVDGKVGRVSYVVPYLGYARAWVTQRAGRTGVFIALGLVGLWTLIEVWLPVPLAQWLKTRRRSRREATDVTADEATHRPMSLSQTS